MVFERKVLGSDAPKVWTIPAGADFLGALASQLASESGLADKPAALASALIYVPNRRSARQLAFKLHQAAGGAPIIPPEIRALGDLETDEPAPFAEAALAGLPPSLDPARRLGALARLVQAYYRTSLGQDIPPVSAIAAGRELSRLLDQAALSESVHWDSLPDLAEDHDLAGHWQNAVKFLSILTHSWPDFLAEEGVMEPFIRQLAAAGAMAQNWQDNQTSSLVLIAGSTGATPASHALMAGAAALPLGRIVLPGLDRSASDAAWTDILATSSHPQHMLARTIGKLGVDRNKVALWPDKSGAAQAEARKKFVSEALAPAELTADWQERLRELASEADQDIESFTQDALCGLGLIEAPDEGVEAELAALLLRETLETKGKTAALVTPDAALARRVSALLKRWNVHVPPSGGVPLGRTKTGSLIGLVAVWALDPANPVALASLLKHPFVSGREGAASLETFFLRGPRRWDDLASLSAMIRRQNKHKSKHDRFTDQDVTAALDLLSDLQAAYDAHINWQDTEAPVISADYIEALAALSAQLANAPLPWAGEDGAAAARLMQSVASIASALGDMRPREITDLIHSECAAMTVSDEAPEHPRLSIWGPLEARLQSADRIILAGLNEDVWPQRSAADAFLPRRFRKALGLTDPEDTLGLAAHDFAQLASAPQVMMLYSARRDDAPAVASRWVWRLRTLARSAQAEDDLQSTAPLQWVRALRLQGQGDLPAEFSPAPHPNPPVEARPKRLSVTRIVDYQRDPYKIYAEQILKLEPLEPLNADLGIRPRGTAVHAALEAFEADGQEKSLAALLKLLESELRKAGEPEDAWLGRRAIWEDTARWYLNWRSKRIENVAKHYLERRGRLELEIAGAPFTLSAIADRIELGHNGELSIIDFKTGSPPRDKVIRTGLEQQMPLQALIASQGGFEGVRGAKLSELVYVAFKAVPEISIVGTSMKPPMSATELRDEAEAGLKKLLTEWRSEEAVFLSAPRPQMTGYGTYDRLARRPEWTNEEGEVSE